MAWSGQLYVLPQTNGSSLVGSALPPGVHAEGSFQVFDGNGPVTPTGFPAMQNVRDVKHWMEEKTAAGFSFTPATAIGDGGGFILKSNNEQHAVKMKDIDAEWQIIIPMIQLDISNESPINGRWDVADIAFMSRQAAENHLRPPQIKAELAADSAKQVFGDYKAYAVLQRKGTPANLLKSVFREVREAKDILAATDAFYGARRLTSGFNLQGYPIITARSAWFVDQDGKNLFGNFSKEGALQPWRLDQNWHANVTQTGIADIFAAITEPALDDAWRRQIRRAAACIGRSLISLERSDAFLLNIFALETLLTRPKERNGKKLEQRIKGMTGWYLKNHRPKYQDEIKDIFEARCDAVHDADYGKLTAEHLLLADLYAKNTLLNVVANRAQFTTKDAMATVLDGWAANENWPQDGSFSLRWVGNATFNPKALDLPLW